MILSAAEIIEELETKFEEKGWSVADLKKYWITSHKLFDTSPKYNAGTYRVNSILRKFLADHLDSSLPEVIKSVAQNQKAIKQTVPRFDCGLISFVFNYLEIRDMVLNRVSPANQGVY